MPCHYRYRTSIGGNRACATLEARPGKLQARCLWQVGTDSLQPGWADPGRPDGVGAARERSAAVCARRSRPPV